MLDQFLEFVDEKHFEKFLKKTYGDAAIESVIKYYDENYVGHLFQVKMADGVNFLPKEEGNYLRIGPYGFVYDDVTKAIPETYNDFETSLSYPEFLKNYILFINNEIGDKKIANETYINAAKNKIMLYLLMRKTNGLVKIKTEYEKGKRLVEELVELSQVKEKE